MTKLTAGCHGRNRTHEKFRFLLMDLLRQLPVVLCLLPENFQVIAFYPRMFVESHGQIFVDVYIRIQAHAVPGRLRHSPGGS